LRSTRTVNSETFQYLVISGDETYRQLDVEHAREICRRYGVEVDDADSELYPRVSRAITEESPRPAIEAVSAAVDALFAAAKRSPPPLS
jgi:hypothetical protein